MKKPRFCSCGYYSWYIKEKTPKPYLWLARGQLSGIITEDVIGISLSRNGSYVIDRISRDGEEGTSDGQSQRDLSFKVATVGGVRNGFDPWGEYPLEEGTATHSSSLAWKIPRTEEPGGVWSIGWQRVGHNSSNLASTHAPISNN